MSKAYALIQFTLINKDLFAQYIKGAFPTILAHGGQVIVAAENPNPQEGSLPTARTTMIEFPSREAAMSWYHSNEYSAIKQLRHEATKQGSLIILDAWQMPTGMSHGAKSSQS
jgi:uncharacterized protein (DUF1330 family)